MNWLIVMEAGCQGISSPERKSTTHFAEKR